jgi:hypothetical protein
MRSLHYDPSRTALYSPGRAPTILAGGITPSDELLCAEAARLVYKPFETNTDAAQESRTAFDRVGFTHVEFFGRAGAPCFAALNSITNTVILTFRGTTRQLDDILTDLNTWPGLWSGGGRVHRGFFAAFELQRPEVSAWLEQRSVRCIVTGHSLGGALATLAATAFHAARLITFGAPRVGNHEFGRGLADVQYARYVGCCDLIARLPPELLGFRHCGALHYIDHAGLIHVDPSIDFLKEDRRLGRRAYAADYALRTGTLKLRDFADHAPINYVYPILARDKLERSAVAQA